MDSDSEDDLDYVPPQDDGETFPRLGVVLHRLATLLGDSDTGTRVAKRARTQAPPEPLATAQNEDVKKCVTFPVASFVL